MVAWIWKSVYSTKSSGRPMLAGTAVPSLNYFNTTFFEDTEIAQYWKKGEACRHTRSSLISMVAALHPDTGGPPRHTLSPQASNRAYPGSSIQWTPYIRVAQKGVLKLLLNSSIWPSWDFHKVSDSCSYTSTHQNLADILEVSKYLTNI